MNINAKAYYTQSLPGRGVGESPGTQPQYADYSMGGRFMIFLSHKDIKSADVSTRMAVKESDVSRPLIYTKYTARAPPNS